MIARQWRRYAFAVQYHGGNALGFSYQGPKGENCLVYEPRSNGTIIQADLRGLESIEGRIRRALNCLVGRNNYQNIQVSSRTDRGVNAWKNTFQVDIRPRLPKNVSGAEVETADGSITPEQWNPKNLVHGINFYLSRLPSTISEEENEQDSSFLFSRKNTPLQCNNTIRILSAGAAPNTRVPNHNYDSNLPQDGDNPIDLPWDVRFTATKRTYAYRILHSYDLEEDMDNDMYSTACYHSYPFEDDRSWRIHDKRPSQRRKNVNTDGAVLPSLELDIDAMNLAGKYLTGTHDFTSFRGKGCQRASPIVTIDSISCIKEKYHGECGEGLLNVALQKQEAPCSPDTLYLVTIIISGSSFVYHQIRNIVACLVEVGQAKKTPQDVKRILEKKDRSNAVGMAPPQGLFLVDVEHGDFKF